MYDTFFFKDLCYNNNDRFNYHQLTNSYNHSPLLIRGRATRGMESAHNHSIRVNSPDSACLLDIGNGPQSGPSNFNGTKGRKAAHQIVIWPKAAKWLIIVQRSLFPVFSTLPKFSAFTLYYQFKININFNIHFLKILIIH